MDGKYTGQDGIDRPASETSLSVVPEFSAAASSNNADLFEIMKVASIISATRPQSHGRGVILLLRFITSQQCQCGFSEHHYIDSPISAIHFDNEALI